MTDLHKRIEAALDNEQRIAAYQPRTLRRIEAERRVLERHSPPIGACDWCAIWPDCPELLDLAARCDVEVADTLAHPTAKEDEMTTERGASDPADYGVPTPEGTEPEETYCRNCGAVAVEHTQGRFSIYGVCPAPSAD